ncbi:signal transduction histidine kinase, nitrate/nitrite-specific [Burkholderiales bacterium JOSHI_001]|nr:signal transduction histidine kinase, nitrate/nitrite-specific [Burkholderiales bacterium JOSHI_001]
MPGAALVQNHGAATTQVLGALAAGLAGTEDLNDLLRDFLRTVMDMVQAQAGAVRVLDPQGRMQLVGQLGLPDAVLQAERVVNPDCGVCGAATLSDQPLWSGDLAACTRRNDDPFFGGTCRHVLAVPLQHRSRVLGVYSLFMASDTRPEAAVLALLKSVGELLGLALEKARLEREQLQAVLQEERRNIAAEVHDSVAQSLAFVKMRLPLLHDAMLAHDDGRAQQYWEDIRGTVGQAHTSLRQILTDFRTPSDPQGFMHAVRALTQDFERRTGIVFELTCPALEPPLSPTQQAQAFQVVQEALANTVRHAGARHAWLGVSWSDGHAQMRVEDDGAGLDTAHPERGGTHYGIDIMKARAQRLGGRLTLEPRDGGGTRVELVFPLQPGAATEDRP